MVYWWGHAASDLLLSFQEFAFPRSCTGCGCSLESTTGRICGRCHESMKPILPEDPSLQKMLRQMRRAVPIADLTVLFYFEEDGVLQTLVHCLKYSGMSRIGRELGALLGEKILGGSEGLTDVGLVPVPLHRVRERERGYNQSASICEGVSSVLSLPVAPRLLRRVRYTESQTSLTPDERSLNVRRAFSVRRRALHLAKGRSLILVDDVLTTGATLVACAEALYEAGAAKVSACALGLAVGEGLRG